jgi:hypothetical protein
MMKKIDLEELTGHGEVHNLSGRVRGLEARKLFNLDEIDGSAEDVEVVVPSHVYSLTPSFVQGLLGASVRSSGNDIQSFRKRYRFTAPAVVMQQLERGLSAILTQRDFASLS